MKTSHRHELKTNAVAEQLVRAGTMLSGHGNQAVWITAGVLVLLLAGGGIWSWRQRGQERAGGALAEAITVGDAEIVAPESGRIPPAGSYPTEDARTDAALKKLKEVIDQYPSSAAATTARFRAAALLASQGKAKDAEQYFQQVVSSDSGIHGRMARVAVADLQVQSGKYDEAIATFRDLTARKDGDLPVDGLLMQLGRAYELAGKRAEALQTYQRVISEFPNSTYVAEARQAADGLKSGAAS